jgi:hypothetical protein
MMGYVGPLGQSALDGAPEAPRRVYPCWITLRRVAVLL